MNEVLKKLGEIGIIPVVVLDDAKDAAPLAKALMEGGLPCAEVTFRTAAAADVIREMVTAYPEIFVGAGTVLTIDQANRAIEAGAKFIVSPGLNPEVVQYCINRGIAVCPGTCTPSEVEQALALGLDTVKFFRTRIYQGDRCSVYERYVHAHRRHQRKERPRVPRI